MRLERAEATIDAYLLEDCDGGTTEVAGPGAIDLLADVPTPVSLPSGPWCGLGVSLSDDAPLALEGTNDGTPFALALDPGLVLLDQEFVVDHDEWVLVLEGWTAVEDPDNLGDALFLGTVYEARDTFYVDLWPFPDIAFGDGDGGVDAVGGCNGGGTVERDPDIGTSTDGGGTDGTDATDGTSGEGGDGGDGSSSSGSASGSGCNGGGGGCSGGSGSGCDCDLDSCATVGFAPPLTFLAGLVTLRRRREAGSSAPRPAR